ncbi:hypothetical protein [Clostridium sporogenes]|uniref:hypothetical protein n=1 Tax=Clostridium sporogenes TaxID=1509 RepID=UPI0022371150|nr:hypothetical protein [Clostridium sporogenes]MCW6111706.1 hypothetical protein [Clostridium sporogenes]
MDNKDRQKVADKKWIEKNREHATYLRNRSSARSFIRNKATMEDLEELKGLIKEREEFIKREI